MRKLITLSAWLLFGCVQAGPPDDRPYLIVQAGPRESVASVTSSPDGRLLAVGSLDGRLRIYDGRTGALLRALGNDPCRGLRAIAFSPDGKRIACGGLEMDKTVKVWDPQTGSLVQTLTGHKAADPGNLYAEVYALVFSPDGKSLATAGRDKLVLVWDLETGKPRHRLEGHEDAVGSLAFSPDGKTLAGGGADRTIRLWDTATGRLRSTLRGHTDRVNALAFTPDGKALASGSSDWSRGDPSRFPGPVPMRECEVRLWDPATEQVRWRFTGRGRVSSLAFSPDGAKLAGGVGNAARLYDAATGREDGVAFTHDSEVTTVAFSPDGRTLYSGSHDRTVAATALPKKALAFRLPGSWHQVSAVAVSADGSLIAAGSNDVRFSEGKRPAGDRALGPGGVRLWDAKAGRLLRALGEPDEQVTSVAFSPDGRRVAAASAGRDGAGFRLWDVRSGSEVWRQTGHKTAVLALAFSPDGQTLATAWADGTVRLRDARTGAAGHTLEGHAGAVTSLAFSADGKLVSGGADQTARLWDARTGRAGRVLRAAAFKPGSTPRKEEGVFTAVALSPDGATVATCGSSQTPGYGDRVVRLWDARTGELKQTLERPQSRGRVVTFSPDGTILASSGTGKAITLWDVRTGKMLREIPGHSHPALSAAFSPDGRTLVSGGDYQEVKLWAVGSGKLRATLMTFTEPGEWAAFTPEGYHDGSQGADRILAWQTAKGERTDDRREPRRRPDRLKESIGAR